MKRSVGKIPAKITTDGTKQAFREHLRSGLGRLKTAKSGTKKSTTRARLPALAENVMVERVKQAASDLRASGKTILPL